MTYRDYDAARDLESLKRIWRECGWVDDDKEAAVLDGFFSVGDAMVATVDDEAECAVLGMEVQILLAHLNSHRIGQLDRQRPAFDYQGRTFLTPAFIPNIADTPRHSLGNPIVRGLTHFPKLQGAQQRFC